MCPQVGGPEVSWDDGAAAASAAGSEHRLRVEREREIACYLLEVRHAEPIVAGMRLPCRLQTQLLPTVVGKSCSHPPVIAGALPYLRWDSLCASTLLAGCSIIREWPSSRLQCTQPIVCSRARLELQSWNSMV